MNDEINDETLVLYYYHDGLSNRERQAVAGAIANDPEVAARYETLARDLGGFADPATPGPSPDRVQRWHDGLDRAADRERQRREKPVVHSWSFLLGAAVTAALAVGIGLGFMLGDDSPETPLPMDSYVVEGTGGNLPNSSAFLRGLQVHLRESERGLRSLDDASGRPALVSNLIAQNRLYETAAEQNDSADLARVLRAFDLVLVQLASEDLDEAEAEALRTKLIFELNVVLTKLSRDSSDEQESI